MTTNIAEIKTLIEKLAYDWQDGKRWASESGRIQASELGPKLLSCLLPGVQYPYNYRQAEGVDFTQAH